MESLIEEERAVLDRIVDGQQNEVIARDLGIGLRTVEARRHDIFMKLQADSLAELLRLVLERSRSETATSWQAPLRGANGAEA